MLVAPGIRRLIAPNPSPMTGPGTNTYLLGEREVAVVDPGPDDAAHLDAIVQVAEAGGGRVTHILLTHSHPDHIPGAWPLRERTGAPVHGWSTIEGIDTPLADGEALSIDGHEVVALFTPGHARDHLAYWLPGSNTLIAGDLVSGFGTIVVAPPWGDLAAYLASLRRVLAIQPGMILPGHYDPIERGVDKLEEYLAHRADRERQLLGALDLGHDTPAAIVQHVYGDTIIPPLVPVAERQVLANLYKLRDEGRVVEAGGGRYRLN